MNRIGIRLILPWLLLAASLAACSAPPVVDPPATPVESHGSGGMENTVIVILGASYAAGWQPAGSIGLRFINKGEGGQQSFEMLERYDRDVLPEKPQAVILWGYINDIFRSDRDGVAAAKDRAKDSFREMIRRSVENGVEPILATEVTIRPRKGFKEAVSGLIGGMLGKEGYQEYVNKQVAELNQWLRDEAGRNGLLLLIASGFSLALGFITFFEGLKRIGPVRASILMNAEPVFTIIIAATLLGERLSSGQLAGAGLVVVAIFLITSLPESAKQKDTSL